ncbi:MAG: hypothetical protein GY799_30015 [Desulfobulbaceae bacterium]|nr:hypothetical protein [Desulfobulbaceae bacterium]
MNILPVRQRLNIGKLLWCVMVLFLLCTHVKARPICSYINGPVEFGFDGRLLSSTRSCYDNIHVWNLSSIWRPVSPIISTVFRIPELDNVHVVQIASKSPTLFAIGLKNEAEAAFRCELIEGIPCTQIPLSTDFDHSSLLWPLPGGDGWITKTPSGLTHYDLQGSINSQLKVKGIQVLDVDWEADKILAKVKPDDLLGISILVLKASTLEIQFQSKIRLGGVQEGLILSKGSRVLLRTGSELESQAILYAIDFKHRTLHRLRKYKAVRSIFPGDLRKAVYVLEVTSDSDSAVHRIPNTVHYTSTSLQTTQIRTSTGRDFNVVGASEREKVFVAVSRSPSGEIILVDDKLGIPVFELTGLGMTSQGSGRTGFSLSRDGRSQPAPCIAESAILAAGAPLILKAMTSNPFEDWQLPNLTQEEQKVLRYCIQLDPEKKLSDITPFDLIREEPYLDSSQNNGLLPKATAREGVASLLKRSMFGLKQKSDSINVLLGLIERSLAIRNETGQLWATFLAHYQNSEDLNSTVLQLLQKALTLSGQLGLIEKYRRESNYLACSNHANLPDSIIDSTEPLSEWHTEFGSTMTSLLRSTITINSAEALAHGGFCRIMLGERSQAKRLLDHSATLDPYNWNAMEGLIWLAISSGDGTSVHLAERAESILAYRGVSRFRSLGPGHGYFDLELIRTLDNLAKRLSDGSLDDATDDKINLTERDSGDDT